MRIIKYSELKSVSWKNGGGMTREIAALRCDDNVIWRLSLADVANDGPFSSFPGMTRILTVVEGKGLRLKISGKTIEVRFGEPVAFDGAWPVECHLMDGPIRDLNVMFDQRLCRADVALHNGPIHLDLQPEARQSLAVVGLAETILVDEKQLGFGDTALIDTGVVRLTLDAHSSALVVTSNRIG